MMSLDWLQSGHEVDGVHHCAMGFSVQSGALVDIDTYGKSTSLCMYSLCGVFDRFPGKKGEGRRRERGSEEWASIMVDIGLLVNMCVLHTCSFSSSCSSSCFMYMNVCVRVCCVYVCMCVCFCMCVHPMLALPRAQSSAGSGSVCTTVCKMTCEIPALRSGESAGPRLIFKLQTGPLRNVSEYTHT